MTEYYKAIRLDGTSHWDEKTEWPVGAKVRVKDFDPDPQLECGPGVHCSPSLLEAVGYQGGPSIYRVVEPFNILNSSTGKVRCEGVQVVRELGREEQDELAGFKLYEANHPVHPFSGQQIPQLEAAELQNLLEAWASVWTSVETSVGAYVGGLFPEIKNWKYIEGSDPWRPLLTLWYAGYVPSFDVETWRLHTGQKAEVALEWTPSP